MWEVVARKMKVSRSVRSAFDDLVVLEAVAVVPAAWESLVHRPPILAFHLSFSCVARPLYIPRHPQTHSTMKPKNSSFSSVAVASAVDGLGAFLLP